MSECGRGGRRLIALGLAALVALASDPLAGPGRAAAQTEPRTDVAGPEYGAFMAALERLTAVSQIVQPERRLAELRAVQATLHRLAAEYPDSLAWAVLGQSLHSGLHPAGEIEQQIAGILAMVDQGVALHEANRAVREERCPLMPEACRLVADAQATAEAIRIDEGASGRRMVGEQRFAAIVAIAAAQVAMGLTADAQLSLGDALVAAPEIQDVQLAAEFARVLALTGDRENAQRSFAYAAEQVLPDAGLQTVIELNVIARAQAGAGMADAAARTFAEALAVKDGLFRSVVVDAQIAAGLFADAAAAAGEIASAANRAITLCDVAAAQAAAGAAADARQMLAAAEAAVEATAGDPFRALVLSRLANAQLALGSADAARATLADALAAAGQTADAGAWFQAVNDIASVQMAAGMHEEVGRTLAGAAVKALALEDPAARLRMLTRIGELQAGAGLTDDARRTFAEGLIVAAQIDNYVRLFAVIDIARAQAGAGLYEDAFASAATLPEGGDGSFVLVGIAAAQAGAGLFADARATADRIVGEAGEVPVEHFRALAEIAKAQAAAAAAQPRE